MTATLLPGIYFRTEVPPVPEALPRMDIAAFVGFARSGPIDVPVAVEDVARFEEIFGGSLPLARQRGTGATIQAQLGPAVRAFFRDGGRRCWVVRVVATPEKGSPAASDHFVIPGLLQAGADGALHAVCAAARSEGSWADALTVNAAVTQRPVTFNLDAPANLAIVSDVAPAEMVRFECPDPFVDRRARIIGFVAIPPSPPRAGAAARRRMTRRIDPRSGSWFRTALPDDLTIASMPAADDPVQWLSLAATAVQLSTQASAPLPLDSPLTFVRLGVRGEEFVLELELPAGAAPATALPTGVFLRLDLASAGPILSSRTLLLEVESVADLSAAAVGSIPSGVRVAATARRAWWSLDPSAAPSWMGAASASIVELDLWVRDGAGRGTRLDGLGLVGGHARALQTLRYDWELFSLSDSTPPDPFLAAIRHPRFPLAFPRSGRASAPTQTVACLPLGLGALVRDEVAQSAVVPPGSAAERDGVAQFSAAALVDPALGSKPTPSLGEEVFGRAIGVETLAADDPRRIGVLPKLHALFPIDEISLLAVPDAGAWGWGALADQPLAPLSAPALREIDPAGADGCMHVEWTAVSNAERYELERADDPLFADAQLTYSGPATTAGCIPASAGCPVARHFRVRAVGAAAGPWSVTRSIVTPERAFVHCTDPTIDPPTLTAIMVAETRVRLTWTVPRPDVVGYEVVQSADPAFGEAGAVDVGAGEPAGALRATALWRTPGAVAYFRVRGKGDGVTSPWSNTAMILADPALPALEALDTEPDTASGALLDEQLMRVHAAMLRFCAARGDCFAVLSLPAHYREDAALAYRVRLAARLADDDPDRTLSFGGLFHPWPVVREERSGGEAVVSRTPPDGTVCGTMAARTISAGAWMAAANVSMRGVVSIEPALGSTATQRFYDAQINQLRSTPRGIRLLSQETLTASRELRDINVRRLLILLRRLVLRDGVDEVFLPNDASFRRLVQRRFEGIFRRLYVRGAFAGATPDEAFRVVTDDSVNDLRSVDLGRFVVELRVAPARPLAFLVVRLVRTSDGVTVMEGN